MENKTAYCRGCIETKRKNEENKGNPYIPNKNMKVRHSRVLSFDTETTTDTFQNLKVGYFEIHEKGVLKENGFFYNPMPENHKDINIRLSEPSQNSLIQVPLSYMEVYVLKEYSMENDIPLYTTKQFIENIFFYEVYGKETLCNGFNLPFDLSRIARKAGNTVKKDPTKGDLLLHFSDDGKLPNIKIGRMGLAESISFTNAGYEGELLSELPKVERRGYFLDSAHLYSVLFGSGTQHFSLKHVCKNLKTEHQKEEAEEHGTITKEYLHYLQWDVKATYDVYKKLEETFNKYGLTEKEITKIYSAASIGKAALKHLGIKPFLDLNPEYPSINLGRIMETYFGGRVECKLRHEIRSTEVLDFTSMYPSTIVLLGLWPFMISGSYKEIKATEEIKNFVDSITLKDMNKKETWNHLVGIVKVKPDKDILPIRAGYNENGEKTVGLQYLTSDHEIWFALSDIVSSKLLTGKTPEIIEAYKYEAGRPQKTLKSHKILGYQINPKKDNLIKFFVEERQKIKNEMKKLEKEGKQTSSEYSEKDGLQLALKILSNALGYGIFIELITQKTEKTLVVCRGDKKFSSIGRSEEEGAFFNPLIGSTITAASRLMLAIAEAKVKELGTSHYYMDTDSIFVPPEIAEEVSEFFNPLNPYENVSQLLKIEDKFKGRITDKKTGEKTPIQYFFGISSKRYVVFAFDEKNIPNISKMEGKLHGMGHITNIFKEEITEEERHWHPLLWKDLILYHMEKLDYEDIISKYGNKYEVAKVAIRTPTIFNRFRKFNEGKEWEKQIKPFNFFNQGNRKDKDIFPIAPMRKNPQYMVKFPFIDYISGEIKEGKEYFKTMDKTFFDYYKHPEIKFEGKKGLLKRRDIFITDIKTIGKEIPSVDETGIEAEEEEDIQTFEENENLLVLLGKECEKAEKEGKTRKGDIERIKKQVEIYKEYNPNEEELAEYAARCLRTLKRTGKDVKRKPVLFTGENKEKILSMTIKEGNDIGISKKNLMDVKAKLREGKALNGNLESTKKIMEYVNKQKKEIKIC
jgi:hypothetical protein